MENAALIAKAAVAVILIVAGGAKLADIPGFTTTVRIFVPVRTSKAVSTVFARALSLLELGLATGSLAFPRIIAFDIAIFILCCMFVVVSVYGYIFHHGRSCRCFGALTARTFDGEGIGRSALMAGLAGFVVADIQPAAATADLTGTILLIVSIVVVGFASYTAARCLKVVRD
jgi:hypothetical protein